MQLTCPNCGARYRVDASQWPTEAGPDGVLRLRPRKARCKACTTVFEALPEEEILELDDPILPTGPEPPLPEPVREPGPAPEPAGPAVSGAGLNPIEAAWPAVSGWPEPVSPGVIHFEAPPVPLPATATAAPGTRATVRLPGPGALAPAPGPPVVIEASEAPPAALAPEGQPGAPDALPEDSEDDEAEDRTTRRWPWVVGALLLLGLGWWWLVASGRIDPTAYGLPPYDPARLPGWAQPAALAVADADAPAIRMPALALPRTPPPPLDVAAEAVRRPMGGNRQVWEISATISNPTEGGLGVPPVELLLLDSAGRIVSRWTVRPETDWLPPGGATRLEASAVAPPSVAERVRVQLKPSDPGRL